MDLEYQYFFCLEDKTNDLYEEFTMKFTKPALSLMALLGAIYMTPVALAGDTSGTPGTNSSTTTTPEGHVVPDPGTPATRAETPSSGTGGTAHDRSDTTKAGEMKSKSMKNCNTATDRNCDENRQNQTR